MLAAAAWDLQGIGTTMEEDGGEGFRVTGQAVSREKKTAAKKKKLVAPNFYFLKCLLKILGDNILYFSQYFFKS